MDPTLHRRDNLAHARWRVNFVRHLVEAHLASPWKGSPEWRQQHADFLLRLAAAGHELERCQREEAGLGPPPPIIKTIVGE